MLFYKLLEQAVVTTPVTDQHVVAQSKIENPAASKQRAMAEAARGMVEKSCYKSTTYRHRKWGER